MSESKIFRFFRREVKVKKNHDAILVVRCPARKGAMCTGTSCLSRNKKILRPCDIVAEEIRKIAHERDTLNDIEKPNKLGDIRKKMREVCGDFGVYGDSDVRFLERFATSRKCRRR